MVTQTIIKVSSQHHSWTACTATVPGAPNGTWKLTQRAEFALSAGLLGSRNWCSDSVFEKQGQGLPGGATPDATVMRLSSSHCTALMLQYVI